MKATTSTSQDLPLLGVWAIEVCADAVPVVTVTLPDGSTATPLVTDVTSGYRAEVTVATVGRYVARVVGTDGAVDFTAYVTGIVAAQGMPDLEALRGDPDADPPTFGYLGETSATDEELQDALDAEAAAQRAVCRVPAAYPADLRQALLRRVARNLALRGLPIMVLRGDAETGSTIPPGRDAEVRRLEAPHRKLVMG